MSVFRDVQALVQDEIWNRKKNHQSPLRRLILGVDKRRQLLRDMPPEFWSSRYTACDKKERFMGIDVLVDFGDPERVCVE